jgi:hypothetical protein
MAALDHDALTAQQSNDFGADKPRNRESRDPHQDGLRFSGAQSSGFDVRQITIQGGQAFESPERRQPCRGTGFA